MSVDREYSRAAFRRTLSTIVATTLGAVVCLSFASGASASASALLCNGRAELCGRSLDRVVLPASHNSMSSLSKGFFPPNQDKSVLDQLRAGIRGLLVDVHYGVRYPAGNVITVRGGAGSPTFGPSPAGLDGLTGNARNVVESIRERAKSARSSSADRLERKQEVFLCHIACELGALPLGDTLRETRAFLAVHRDVVLSMIFEDRVSPQDIALEFDRSGLSQMVYRGSVGGTWPTLAEMVSTNRRVVVTTESGQPGVPWILPAFGVFQDTPFTHRAPDRLVDPNLLAAGCTANRGPANAPLFLMNHWVLRGFGIPLKRDAATVNTRTAIVARARACAAVRGRMVNMIAVDFSGIGDVVGAGDVLNGLSPSVPVSGALSQAS